MIKLKNVTKKYGDKTVYDNFSFAFDEDRITAFLGESGAGKTTLLNIIAGLTDYDGEVVKDGDVSFVFQTDRLVKNLTVKENLKLVLKNATEKDILDALDSVGLSAAIDLYPKELSAGMARRVAILRAFLYPCKILLMDEPFINLDVSLKFSLINTVKKMQGKTPKTVVFVTHDIKEAVTLADRIVLLKHSEIVYDNPSVSSDTENEIYSLLLNGNSK